MAWILEIAHESRPIIAHGATEYPAEDVGTGHPDASGADADGVCPPLRPEHPHPSPVGAGASRARRPRAYLPFRNKSHSRRRRERAGDSLMFAPWDPKAPRARLTLFLFARAPMPFFVTSASPDSRSWLRGRSVTRYDPATGAEHEGALHAMKAGSLSMISRTGSLWAQPRSISSRQCSAIFSTIFCGATSRHGTGDPR